MNLYTIDYKNKTANEQSICNHLTSCDNNFNPPLHERVNIKDYSKKIFSNAITFEAWYNRLLIGMIAAYFNNWTDKVAYITSVSTINEYSGKGVGCELIAQCVEYARINSFKLIQLEVEKNNDKAIRLYKKFGFTENEIKGSFVLMSKNIE